LILSHVVWVDANYGYLYLYLKNEIKSQAPQPEADQPLAENTK